MFELIDAEVWDQSEYFCDKCPGAVRMKYEWFDDSENEKQ